MPPRTSSPIAASTCHALIVGAAFLVAACQPSPPEPGSPARTTPNAAVAPLVAVPPAPATIALPSMSLPPGPIYVCTVAGERTPIEYADNVDALCRRHPEMGPCQYERNACRRRGGRVYTANGEEVTQAVEAEYDRKVRRVTFRADGAPAQK